MSKNNNTPKAAVVVIKEVARYTNVDGTFWVGLDGGLDPDDDGSEKLVLVGERLDIESGQVLLVERTRRLTTFNERIWRIHEQ